MQRKSLSKKLRFEVFKRDSFTCQYCGGKAPDITLQVDHLEPVSKGGTNDILNLITSCKDCNSGKSNRRLSDTSLLDKQRQQLEDLQERKEQIEMMFQWQKSLTNLDDQVIDQLSEFWNELTVSYSLNDNGKRGLRKLLRQNELSEVMQAMKIAAEQYLEYDDEGNPTQESVEKAWKKVGGICRIKKIEAEKPYMPELYYIRGILRNRLHYVNERLALQMLEECVHLGANVESLKKHALEVRNWTQWRTGIEQFIEEQNLKESDENSDEYEGEE